MEIRSQCSQTQKALWKINHCIELAASMERPSVSCGVPENHRGQTIDGNLMRRKNVDNEFRVGRTRVDPSKARMRNALRPDH
jgi:hypothetical protein